IRKNKSREGEKIFMGTIHIEYDEAGKTKIGGWLTFITAIVYIRVIAYIYQIVLLILASEILPAIIFLYELFLNIFFLIYAVKVIILIKERSVIFKKCFPRLVIYDPFFRIIESILVYNIYNSNKVILCASAENFIYSLFYIIFSGILVWYIKKSQRVSLTFTEQKNEDSTKKETNSEKQIHSRESSKDIFYIPPDQAIKCPECGRDILKSSSYCYYCKTFISRNYVYGHDNTPPKIEGNSNAATTKVDNQEKQNVASLNPNELIGKEILTEFKALVDLSPRAAAMALENSPVGECLRKRLREYGASSAMDRADIFLILKKLNLEEQSR
ncbi:hypothetical protein, partial [uncultured Bilophila sp.]|uniref:hypothetical protein n=1 Tax=uncultured Bilophila sp. TaxID=529385 RepID=UPI0026DC1815